MAGDRARASVTGSPAALQIGARVLARSTSKCTTGCRPEPGISRAALAFRASSVGCRAVRETAPRPGIFLSCCPHCRCYTSSVGSPPETFSLLDRQPLWPQPCRLSWGCRPGPGCHNTDPRGSVSQDFPLRSHFGAPTRAVNVFGRVGAHGGEGAQHQALRTKGPVLWGQLPVRLVGGPS